MFKPQRINELLEERRIKKVELCKKVNISATTLNRTTDHGAEIGCIKLERIADFFQVPMDYFFDRDYKQPESNTNNIEIANPFPKENKTNGDSKNDKTTIINNDEQQEEIEHLKAIIIEQNSIIQLLIKQNERFTKMLYKSEKEIDDERINKTQIIDSEKNVSE